MIHCLYYCDYVIIEAIDRKEKYLCFGIFANVPEDATIKETQKFPALQYEIANGKPGAAYAGRFLQNQ